MPRRPRVDFPGAFHHVIVRGVDRRNLFCDEDDRVAYCSHLSLVFPDEGAACLAWALMPNHVHLVVRTGARPLARVMHRVGTRYARHFNDRYGRSGYLFQGRYRAIAVSDDAQLATLVRYVHANPLRAGLVASIAGLAQHRWTGHPALVGTATAAPFHDARAALQLFDDSAERARASLCEFMSRGDAVPQPAGWEDRVRAEPRAAGAVPAAPVDPGLALRALVARVCAEQGVAEDALRSGSRHRALGRARATVAYLASRDLGVSLAETARHLGVSRQALWSRVEQERRAASQRPREIGRAPRPPPTGQRQRVDSRTN